MTLGPMANALAPLHAKMPKAVQEREILRVVALLEGIDPVAVMKQAQREILIWAQNRSGGQLPETAWGGLPFEYFSGGRTTLVARIPGDDIELWALRGDDPDKEVPGRIWTTEVTLGRTKGTAPQLALRLIVSSSELDLSINPHVPGLVQQIAAKCGLRSGPYPLDAMASVIESEGDVAELIDMLEAPDRKLPILVVSGDERSRNPNQPLVNADKLATATLGLAHVFVLPARFTYGLSDIFGKARSVYHGAIRIYLPSFDSASDPFVHRLFLGDAVKDDPDGICTNLRLIVASESLRRTRLGHDVLPFVAVRSAALKLEQQARANSGANEIDQLETAKKQVTALEAEIAAAKNEASQNWQLAQEEEERAIASEAQLNAARARIQVLEEQFRSRGFHPDADIVIPDAWEELADWCDTTFAGRLVLSPVARRGIRNPRFEDIELVGRSLVWLAGECRTRRLMGGGTLANIQIESGVENAPCGNDTFQFDFQGRRLNADWHVKSGGNTRDPARCLRIYYTFDDVTQQVIVADMPAHRRTAAS